MLLGLQSILKKEVYELNSREFCEEVVPEFASTNVGVYTRA